MEMNKIFYGLSPEEKLENLRALSVKAERGTYSRTLSAEELLAEEKSFIRKSTDLTRLKAEAKEKAQEYKAKVDGISDELEEMLKRINNGKREVVGVLFQIPNHQTGQMNSYDATGELIDTRPLKGEEKQLRAFIQGPAGTEANPHEYQDAEVIPPGEDGSATGGEGLSKEEAIKQMEEGEPAIAGNAPVRPGDTGDKDWEEFEKKAAAEAQAKAKGDSPAKAEKKSRPRKTKE